MPQMSCILSNKRLAAAQLRVVIATAENLISAIEGTDNILPPPIHFHTSVSSFITLGSRWVDSFLPTAAKDPRQTEIPS
jgi:hypothetical protein